MRCMICNRVTLRPAVTIPQGVIGPKCAKRIKEPQKRPKMTRKAKVGTKARVRVENANESDFMNLDLFEGCE